MAGAGGVLEAGAQFRACPGDRGWGQRDQWQAKVEKGNDLSAILFTELVEMSFLFGLILCSGPVPEYALQSPSYKGSAHPLFSWQDSRVTFSLRLRCSIWGRVFLSWN